MYISTAFKMKDRSEMIKVIQGQFLQHFFQFMKNASCYTSSVIVEGHKEFIATSGCHGNRKGVFYVSTKLISDIIMPRHNL